MKLKFNESKTVIVMGSLMFLWGITGFYHDDAIIRFIVAPGLMLTGLVGITNVLKVIIDKMDKAGL